MTCRMILIRSFPFLALMLMACLLRAQDKAIVFGRIADDKNRPVELVNISLAGLPGGTTTDKNGHYELAVPAGDTLSLIISFVGYQGEELKVILRPGEKREINRTLFLSTTELPEIRVEDKQIRQTNLVRINPRIADVIPGATDGIPLLVKTQLGVSSSNELSSQYSVRGGNYDENLVYVNDIEIYRPLLIRSGEQEGLSFVNSDLISSILFSAGGFDAKYGDKLSSALDIQYKKPKDFGGSVSASLLGGSAHLEGSAAAERFTYLAGVRYKSNQYLLKSMETKGEYKPSFTDVQSLLGYRLSEKAELSFLGYYARNSYKLIPESRETVFGTIQDVKKLMVYFDGQEVDSYETLFGALTGEFRPAGKVRLKLIASGFQTLESETYDVAGQYWIGQIDNSQGGEESGNVIETQGVGTYLNHARNAMNAIVFNVEQRGVADAANRTFQWGIKYQNEIIDDRMNEWVMVDSSGYSIPRPPDSLGYGRPANPFEMYSLIKTTADLNTNRYSAFLQNKWGTDDNARFTLTAGLRASYWDFNEEFFASPRLSASFRPEWKNDVLFRISAGLYYQPPFYKELRDLDGHIHNDVKSQSSLSVVAGSDWNFMAWSRPFKFVTEVYYKHLENLIPYFVDNVRIRYLATNNSHGYAAGIDMKVNGEFVRGVESWASLSVMKTEEDLEDDYYFDGSGNRREPGFIPRPTDQRVSFSMFFQDYLPKHPTFKMSLTLIFGSSLPFGPPQSEKYLHTKRIPPYRRVDIGFSKQIIGEESRYSSSGFFRQFESLWITAEVLNLLQVNNTVSYIWVTDVYGSQYAVPNYLTPRQLNVRLIAKF